MQTPNSFDGCGGVYRNMRHTGSRGAGPACTSIFIPRSFPLSAKLIRAVVQFLYESLRDTLLLRAAAPQSRAGLERRMRLSFIYPAALALLALLPLLISISLAVPRRLSPARFRASLVVRSLLVIALVGAIAGTQFVHAVDTLTTVFVIDTSDSISASLRGQAEAFVHDAIQGMRATDQAAIVVFGENALVERAPLSERTMAAVSSVPVVARTNIQDALQLGLALFPADTQKRIVLLSDGGENAGNALDAARLAQARHIPISYVDLSSTSDAEALVADLRAPTRAHAGEAIHMTAVVQSTLAQSARLRLFGNDQLLSEQQVELHVGANSFDLAVTAGGQGFQRYRAEIAARRDARSENNQATALVRVAGPPRVLLVEGQPGEAQQLAAALTASSIVAQIVAPDAMPADLTGLSDYEAVALVNVAAQDLPVRAVASLPAYVRDLGRGLLMIGGDRSFGVGGYSHTPLEDALPVYMDVRDREERPDLALVFIIDKSGSMDACHCSGPNRQNAQITRGGTPKITIAKDAVAQAAAVLRPTDTLGVVAFDGASHWVIPASAGHASSEIVAALSPLAPDGGTNVRAGLQAAEQTLRTTNTRIKHAILLTDGWSGGGDNLDIARQMRAEGITLSVIAAGSGSADYLAQLADAGGGRYYPAQTMEEVPQVFVQETITAVGNYLIEEPFTPAYAEPSAIFDGLTGGLPQLYGYNGTTPKETASVALVGVDRAPVLAQWQYGLGRSAAWTSDLTGRWGKDFVRWSAFPRFAAQLVDWVLPRQSDAGLDTSFVTQGTQTVLDVQVRGADNAMRDGLTLDARLVDANGTVREAGLTQVAPGEYRASIANAVQGTYLVQVTGKQDDRVVAQSMAGLVIPYSPEYRQAQNNPALLAALASATGGALLAKPAAAFAPVAGVVSSAQEIALPLLVLALLLLPLDIAIRRFLIRRSDLQAAYARFRQPAAAPVPSSDVNYDRLRAAKQRAKRRTDREDER